MLPVRTRITVIVTMLAALVLIAASCAAIVVTGRRFTASLRDSLVFANDIAAGLVCGEVNRLKEETAALARQLAALPRRETKSALIAFMDSEPNSPWLALSVLTRDGTLEYSGSSDARVLIRDSESEYCKRAFSGETIISSTSFTPEGQLVMRVWTAIDTERVFAASIAGTHLSRLLAPYRLWETGGVFIVDRGGVIIAESGDSEAPLERRNYSEWDNKYPEYREMARAFRTFAARDSGVEMYSVAGIQTLCAYRVIEGTDRWTAALSAPLDKSPFAEVTDMLALCALLILVCAVIAAYFASHFIIACCQQPAPPPENAASGGANNAVSLKNASIPGINLKRTLPMFENDEETYLLILRSYTVHIPAFIETIKNSVSGDIDQYRIAVHAIKGSSRNIGAEQLGDDAEKLEHAALEKDTAFIKANTGPFVKAAEKIVGELGAYIANMNCGKKKEKPEKERPERESLDAILKACENYDINALKEAIETLDHFSYLSWPGLADWLREQAGISNFDEIQRRLS